MLVLKKQFSFGANIMDYKNKKIVGEDEIKKWGGEVLTLKFIKGLSSSKFIDKFGI